MLLYADQGVFEFIISLLIRISRAFLFQMPWSDLQTEDLQFLALVLSGIVCIKTGFYLVHNRLTMLANSLSHTVLLSLVLCVIFYQKMTHVSLIEPLPLYLQLLAAVFTAFFTLTSLRFLSKWLSPEASNAFSFTGFFALGILTASIFLKNTHLGLESVMGNLEAVGLSDLQRLLGACVLVYGVMYLIKSRLDLSSFDALFAETIGVKTTIYKNILVLICSLGLMVCFRSLGVILILTLLTAPILTAKLFTSDKRKIYGIALLFVFVQSLICLMLVHAVYDYFGLPVSTAGMFSCLGLVGYLISTLVKSKKLKIKSKHPE